MGAPAPASAAKPAAAGAAAAASSPAKIRVGLATETLGRGPLYVANRKGYLRDAGIEIERVNLEGDPRLVAAFLANEIDVAGFGADTVVKMWSPRGGTPSSPTAWVRATTSTWSSASGSPSSGGWTRMPS
jgi:ABC-type nitrate/sulfonate/bicarbonate transport system substrate-binding protein